MQQAFIKTPGTNTKYCASQVFFLFIFQIQKKTNFKNK